MYGTLYLDFYFIDLQVELFPVLYFYYYKIGHGT